MIRDLQVLYRVGSLSGLTDRQLLERFRSASSAGDDVAAESALSILVERHAAMVWNVCRSLIRDRHDAEDAFQATFLILVRKARSLNVVETLGPWLHVVAYRTASSVRASSARRRQVERSAVASLSDPVDTSCPVAAMDLDDDELRASIHAEIRDLPESFRRVFVLCDLEGLSYRDAADRLGIPMGTVQSRLARARLRLRRGLTLRGIHPPDANEANDPLPARILGTTTFGTPPASLIGRAGRLGALIASDPTGWKTGVTGPVQALMNGVLRSIFFGTLGRVLVVVLGGILVGGAVLFAAGEPGQKVKDATGQESRRPASQGQVKRPVEIPASRQLSVASGTGKALLYLLDREEKRIPQRAEGKFVRFQEVEREIRWAVVTGVLDHHLVQKALITADRKPLPPDRRLYARLELERQTLEEDSWSNWRMVDVEANLKILDNLPEIEAERIPEPLRDIALVDPLPHLTRGEWRGADIEEFVPAGAAARKGLRDSPPLPPGLQRDRPDVLMVRSLDLTVEPGRTYRYRARVVLFNPHFDRAKNPRKFLFGPWSDATPAVIIPRPDDGGP